MCIQNEDHLIWFRTEKKYIPKKYKFIRRTALDILNQ